MLHENYQRASQNETHSRKGICCIKIFREHLKMRQSAGKVYIASKFSEHLKMRQSVGKVYVPSKFSNVMT